MRKLSIFFLLALTACFETREPEAPTQSGSDWITPNSVDIILENFRKSVIGMNLNNYQRSFTEDFSFDADPDIAAQNEGVFLNDWTLQTDERDYFLNLSDSNQQPELNELSFTEREDLFFNSDSVQVQLNYDLRVVHQRESEGIPFDYAGQLTFTIVRNKTNEFYIKIWQDRDINGDNLDSWSALKLNFRS